MNKKIYTKNDIMNNLVELLLLDAKMPYREIAKKLKVSIGTITNKIHQLEKEGIIKRYTVKVDYEKLGYEFEVLIFTKIKKAQFPVLFQKYIKDKNVFTIYDVTGTYDAVISAKFRTRREMDLFIKKLQEEEYIEYTITNLILNSDSEEKIT
jgi:Lrp/AsnC family transcriptional regulator, regulator for asnA, asnC and gidA